MMKKRAERDRRENAKDADGACEDRTTIRASVTDNEHAAIWRVARVKCGVSLDEFVRQSVDAQLLKVAGKPLAVLAREEETKPVYTQLELF